jgi:hypothetical protein
MRRRSDKLCSVSFYPVHVREHILSCSETDDCLLCQLIRYLQWWKLRKRYKGR